MIGNIFSSFASLFGLMPTFLKVVIDMLKWRNNVVQLSGDGEL